MFPQTICFPSLVYSAMQFKARQIITGVRVGKRGGGTGEKRLKKSVCISSVHDFICQRTSSDHGGS